MKGKLYVLIAWKREIVNVSKHDQYDHQMIALQNVQDAGSKYIIEAGNIGA